MPVKVKRNKIECIASQFGDGPHRTMSRNGLRGDLLEEDFGTAIADGHAGTSLFVQAIGVGSACEAASVGLTANSHTPTWLV